MADIQPIQSGDGAQPAIGGAPRVPFGGFGPSPTPNITTNVTAPLDVTAGPGQAAYLAAQLKNSLDTLRRPMMYAEESQGLAAATKSLQQGEADALAGRVDAGTAQQDSNYNAGVVKVTAQRAALNATTKWQQYVADPKNNVAGMSVQQVGRAYDEFMRKQLGGLETDPVAAQAMEPILTHTVNETVGRFLQFKTQENFNSGVANAVQLAQAQIAHGGAAFQYGDQLATLTALAHGNRAYAKSQLDSGLIQAAVANSNPALLDVIQAPPGQKALPPATQLAIQQARQRIAVESRPANLAADRSAQTSALMAVLNGQNPRDVIKQYVSSSPLPDPAMVPRLMDFAHSLSTETSTDEATGSDAAGITAGIVKGDISSPSDLLNYVDQLGVTGKARQQLLTEGLSTMSKVRSDMVSNPYYQTTAKSLDLRYKPKTPLPGMAIDQGQAAQYGGLMADYATEYTKLVQGGKAPAEAAYTASKNVTEKYGDPLSALSSATSRKQPQTDGEQVHLLTTDPKGAKAAGITGADIQRLYETGQITEAQVVAIGRAYLSK